MLPKNKTFRILIIILIVELFLQLFSILIYQHYKRTNFLASCSYAPYIQYLYNHDKKGDFYTIHGENKTSNSIWILGGYDYKIKPRFGQNFAEKLLISLNDNKYNIYNLCQPEFIIDQNRVFFLELLRYNNKPDAIVFYSGLPEIKSNIVGYPQYTEKYSDVYEVRISRHTFLNNLFASKIKLIFILEQLINYPFQWKRPKLEQAIPFNIKNNSPTDLEDSARSIVDNYIYNTELIESVCASFNIKCFFVWDSTCGDPTNTQYAQLNQKIYQELNKSVLKTKHNLIILSQNNKSMLSKLLAIKIKRYRND